MTKTELFKMLSDVPDDAQVHIIEERSDLLSRSVYSAEIKGYFERNGYYILCGLNVRPYTVGKHD